MFLYMVLPPTQRLNELIAAIALHGKTQVPVNEEDTTLFRYAWSVDCTEIVAEIFGRVGTGNFTFYNYVANSCISDR
jgi:hypothetical protein